jgi:hypothetical protein
VVVTAGDSIGVIVNGLWQACIPQQSTLGVADELTRIDELARLPGKGAIIGERVGIAYSDVPAVYGIEPNARRGNARYPLRKRRRQQ